MTETRDAPERPSESGTAPTIAIGLVLVVVGAILLGASWPESGSRMSAGPSSSSAPAS